MRNLGVIKLSNTESYKLQIMTKYISGKIYKDDAATLLKVSERTISRYAKSLRDKGPSGIKHGNSGIARNRKWSKETKDTVLSLKSKTYFDFNTAHFTDILKQKHKLDIPYNTVREWLLETNLVKTKYRKRRRKHVYRTRMAQEGLLLQMEGSPHKCNGMEKPHSPLDPFLELDKVLCIEETRVIASAQTISYEDERLLLSGSKMNFGRYEAVIRTNLKGDTKFFVMEKEVKATPVEELGNTFDPTKKRKRLESLDPVENKDINELFRVFGDEPVHLDYAKMWRTISELDSALREHKVLGKPLKIKRPKKVA